ncbi:MAG: ribose 5-phosphate isomerase B [Rhodospirillales bacterium]|nr:ribose 5-phosphate isomerase B [Alphaproteobacteria bacterium]USO03464.1 MAG: ribose 5-phosphate isomerase B [Rhodospirillales bacterium]
MVLKVAIASDHAGFALKEFLKEKFDSLDAEWVDLGTDGPDSVDYPDFGYKVADYVAGGRAPFGVAICGSGIGISIAANRNPKVRAALCRDSNMAALSRQHNDANVLCLGERLTPPEEALEILRTFLTTDFEGGRHAARVEKLGKETR